MSMQIISCEKPEDFAPYISEIEAADWSGAKSLARLINSGTFFEKLGESASLLILLDEGKTAAFCTLAEHDDIPETDLGPWIGYVFTDPAFRGRHLAGRLIEEAERRAKDRGCKALYISTGHEGLYEKYGYSLYERLQNKHGVLSRVYKKDLG